MRWGSRGPSCQETSLTIADSLGRPERFSLTAQGATLEKFAILASCEVSSFSPIWFLQVGMEHAQLWRLKSTKFKNKHNNFLKRNTLKLSFNVGRFTLLGSKTMQRCKSVGKLIGGFSALSCLVACYWLLNTACQEHLFHISIFIPLLYKSLMLFIF